MNGLEQTFVCLHHDCHLEGVVHWYCMLTHAPVDGRSDIAMNVLVFQGDHVDVVLVTLVHGHVPVRAVVVVVEQRHYVEASFLANLDFSVFALFYVLLVQSERIVQVA